MIIVVIMNEKKGMESVCLVRRIIIMVCNCVVLKDIWVGLIILLCLGFLVV